MQKPVANMITQDAAGSCRAEPIVMPPNNRVHNSLVVRFPRRHQGHLEKRHGKYRPKDKQFQHDSEHNTPSPQVGPKTTHAAAPSNYQTVKTIFQALGLGISGFILLTMFAIFISNPVEAATEISQVSIKLNDVDSGQLLLRSEHVISSTILLTTDVK